MAISEYKTGTATIGTTEYSLVGTSGAAATDTTDGVFQVFIDLSNLASGDEYLVVIKEKVTSGGSQVSLYSSSALGAQSPPVWVSPSLILMHGWDVTMDKLSGTDRSISWSIRQVA